jgi:hypothetical protein
VTENSIASRVRPTKVAVKMLTAIRAAMSARGRRLSIRHRPAGALRPWMEPMRSRRRDRVLPHLPFSSVRIAKRTSVLFLAILTAMTRRADPVRVYAAQREGIFRRLVDAHGLSEEQAELLIRAWEDEADRRAIPRLDSHYWTTGEEWMLERR